MELPLRLFDYMPASWILAAGKLRGRHPWVKAGTDWLPSLLRNREGRIQKGLGRGLRFDVAHSAVGFLLGTHDLEVQYTLACLLRPGMTVYDIGANVGFIAVLAARQVSPGGKVVCFEPLVRNAEQIRCNAALNGFECIQIHRVALGGADGDADFLVSRSPTWGRLARAGATPLQSRVERVPVRSLDSLAADGEPPAPHLVKIDVEGAEAEVIFGGKGLFSRARPVLVVELHHTYRAVNAALAELDYTVRPLTLAGAVASTDGEFQILAYPRERADAEAVLNDLTAGKMDFR